MAPPEIFKLIESELAEVESRLKTEAKSNLPLVNEMNSYLHDSGGKRLRPSLLLLISKMCGVEGEGPIHLSAVVELIHVATLVHDDIIDNSGIRRGQTSLNAKWGNQITVLFGDWLYMTSFWIALKEKNFRILDILIDITRKMVEGELIQLERSGNLNISLDEHLAICWHKTAHLFSGCGRLGAILGRLPSEREKALADYGEALGMAFQLIDDLLDYTADEAILGKPVLKDLEEGKVTLPIIHLMKQSSAEERAFLIRTVQTGNFTPDAKRRILALVEHYGTLERARDLALEYCRRATHSVSGFPPSIYREALQALPELIVNRRR